MSFTHLHLHDQFSLSDGACKTSDVVKRVKELGMDACAQTNHGNCYGHVQFYKECRKHGIKPILGIEAYVSPGSRFDRKFVMATDHERAGNYHLILLAQNEQGYKNLCQLSSLAFTEGFYYKPRIDKELMAAYGEGLIVTSGCLSGELSRNLLVGNEARAEEVAAEYARLFPGRFYIEIQPNHITEQEKVNPALIHLARKLGLPLVATNDCILAGAFIGVPNGTKLIEDVQVGDQVLTHHGRACRVLATNRREVNERIFSIKGVLGTYAIKCTANHPLLAIKRRNPQQLQGFNHLDEPQWVRAEDIRRRDLLCIPKIKPRFASHPSFSRQLDITSIVSRPGLVEDKNGVIRSKSRSDRVAGVPRWLKLDRDFCRMLGLFLAEGNINNLLIGFGLHRREEHLVRFLTDYFAQFGFSPKTTDNTTNGVVVRLSSCIWPSVIRHFIDYDPKRRHKNIDFSRFSEEEFSEILKAYFEGDGHIDLVRQRASIESVSQQLIFNLSNVLNSVGICVIPTIRDGLKAASRHPRATTAWRDGYELSFSSRNLSRLNQLCKFGWALSPKKSRSKMAESGSYFFVPVKSVDSAIVKTPVYNFQVENDESYICNGFAVHNCHYTHREHAASHEVLLCVQSKSVLSDPDRWKFDSDHLYIKSPEEIRQEFPDHPEAISNTLEIAKQCNVELKLGRYHFPKATLPPAVSAEDQLRHDALAGLEKLLRDGPLFADQQVYRDRLDYELKVICEMGFAGYFLITKDFVAWAKQNGIMVGPCRGSVGGALSALVLGITEIDPIRFGLLFERFLNPGRAGSCPDIDLDFDDKRRDEVVEYVKNKYGHDKVAKLITFGTLKGKAAIRDVARVLEVPYTEAEKITKAYPAPKHGKEWTLAQAFEMEPRLAQIRDGSERGAALFEHAFRLEGLTRHASTHAAGVVISPKPLVEYLPLAVDKEKQIVTQFSMRDAEDIGLVKFDFLGLKTLSLIQDTLQRIKANRGIELDLVKLPLDDAATYKMLRNGDTLGVFQMEGGGIRRLIVELKPTCIDDLASINTLYRPGPLESGATATFLRRKNGLEEVNYDHPALEPVLKATYGVPIYQESISKMAQVLAGYTPVRCESLRKACGKKIAEEMAAHRSTFVDGCVANGINFDLANHIFDQIETFSAYGFCAAHAYGYSLISYRTAYLKAHYPVEFMAALLTNESGDRDKTHKNLTYCKKTGIKVLPPDINKSNDGFTVAGDAILFGLGAIKGVGEKAIEAIVALRAEKPITGLYDLMQRGKESRQTNKRVVDALVRAGALDELDDRGTMLSMVPGIIKDLQKKKKSDPSQIALFALPEPTMLPAEPPRPMSETERLTGERETLGFFISGHPLNACARELKAKTDTSTSSIRKREDGSCIKIGGVVHSVVLKNTKTKGERYAIFQLEDLYGSVEVVMWPRTYMRYADMLTCNDPVIVIGRVEVKDEGIQFIADEMEKL